MKMRMAFLVAAMAIGGQAAAQAISGAPYVAVHGEANREVVPDIFPIEVTLSETSTDPAVQGKIESLAATILEVADQMKVPAADLSLPNLSISPNYDYDDKLEKQIFLGNTYQREIKVRFHTLDALRQFIAGLPDDKSVRIDTGQFATSRAREIRRELMGAAIADARATAEALAAGAGRKLGPVHTISNRAFNVSYSDSGDATNLGAVSVMGRSLAAPPPPVVLREGRITLDQDVYIIYTLE